MKDHEKRELVSELVGIASIAHGTEQLRDRIAYALSGVFSAIDGVTGRADKAEAELERLSKQEPVAYVKYKATGGNVGLSWLAVPTGEFYPREGEPLYAAPVPAVAAPAGSNVYVAPIPAPESNPVQWLEDEGDNILVPRGLLGAACSAIRNKRPGDKIVAALRHYTQSGAPAPCRDCGMVWADQQKYADTCVAEILRQDAPAVPDTSGRHVCGLQGFGNSLDDVCPACASEHQQNAPAVPDNFHAAAVAYLESIDRFNTLNDTVGGGWSTKKAGTHQEIVLAANEMHGRRVLLESLLHSTPQSSSEPVAHHPV